MATSSNIFEDVFSDSGEESSESKNKIEQSKNNKPKNNKSKTIKPKTRKNKEKPFITENDFYFDIIDKADEYRYLKENQIKITPTLNNIKNYPVKVGIIITIEFFKP